MDFSARNKKVAVARWTKVLTAEKNRIPNSPETLRLKAALCGFLAGDGSVQVRDSGTFSRHDIGFYPDDKLMLKIYCNALRQVYGKKPAVSKRSNMFEARITSRTIVEDLLKYSKFGVHSWNVPHLLFKVAGAKEAWLRAFFSAEAYVGPEHIKIQTVNGKGMQALSDLLSTLGIAHRRYEYQPKKKNYSLVYILFISRKEARKLFYHKIGFWHRKKTKKLKKSLGL